MTNHADWYYRFKSRTGELYASARQTYVPEHDAQYVAWLDAEDLNIVAVYSDEEELASVLDHYKVPHALTELDIDRVRADALDKINARHSELLKQLTGNASAERRDTWSPKAIAAEAHLAGNATDVQALMLSSEAAHTGETVDALAAKIADKAAAYAVIAGEAEGLRRKGEAAAAAARSVGEIRQILSDLEREAAVAVAKITGATEVDATGAPLGPSVNDV